MGGPHCGLTSFWAILSQHSTQVNLQGQLRTPANRRFGINEKIGPIFSEIGQHLKRDQDLSTLLFGFTTFVTVKFYD